MRTATYFISDCHLGAGYIADRRTHEARLVDWLESIAPTAARLFLLGDILDYWFEYRCVVPRGYVRFFGALARLADNGTEITWLRGNHDIWLFDYLAGEIGLNVADNVIERTIDGKRFVMSHGDGIGFQSTGFSIIRAMFRNPVLQKLYSSIHPRWTVGFAHAWSSHNRKIGKAESFTHLPDDDRYVRFAEEYCRRHGHVDYFIFGHRHIVIDQPGPDDSRIIVAGDGFQEYTYVRFDGVDLNIDRF